MRRACGSALPKRGMLPYTGLSRSCVLCAGFVIACMHVRGQTSSFFLVAGQLPGEIANLGNDLPQWCPPSPAGR